MAKPSKRPPKQAKAARAIKPAKEDAVPDIPAAFSQAPVLLAPFLASLHHQDRIYLTHIDTHPAGLKRQIFLFPLLLNSAIILAIAYRAYVGMHTYPELFAAFSDPNSPFRINTVAASWSFLSSTVARRALGFLVDYLLIALFLPWPVRFVLGPLRWRWNVGFRAHEIVIRHSREWSEKLQRGSWIRDDDDAMKNRVIPAVLPERLQKTGYLLIDADWDLDFDAMVHAHRLVDDGQEKKGPKMQDFETSVFAHGGGKKGWLCWKVEEEDGAADSGADVDADGELPPEARDRIIAFKNKLVAKGKEDLFYRWVEIIQYESTRPGGFTPERQRNAMLEVKRLFEKEGLDFQKFWEEVGGMEGISL